MHVWRFETNESTIDLSYRLTVDQRSHPHHHQATEFGESKNRFYVTVIDDNEPSRYRFFMVW
jgi:hypothetical protein